MKQESERQEFVSNKSKNRSIKENFDEKYQATKPVTATSLVSTKQWYQ